MHSIVALASGATALNLALTGITVEEITDPKDAETRCAELMQNGPSVLIIEEGLRYTFSDRMRDRMARHKGDPLIVYCPAFEQEDADVDGYLSSVIKPAVGFEIRLT